MQVQPALNLLLLRMRYRETASWRQIGKMKTRLRNKSRDAIASESSVNGIDARARGKLKKSIPTT